MKPTLDWLHQAEVHIRRTLEELRPKLLEAQGKIEHQQKEDKSAVTEVDTLVEECLRRALREFDASIGYGGEETGVDYDQTTFWLVDPIDGTDSFIRGLPYATNMISLIDRGQPILSVINNFSLDEYDAAVKGQGATRNGRSLRVSSLPLDHALVSFGHSTLKAKEAFGLIDIFRERYSDSANAFNASESGYAMSTVASGGIEARIVYRGGAKPWDHAPGALLIQEAGGRVANIGSDSYDYRNTDLVAANPVVFGELMQFMSEIAARRIG